jgi:pimeloyl-ACP methyl ester carboxylesterase
VRRPLLVTLASLALGVGAADTASAAFSPCSRGSRVLCDRVSVPLDRSGAVAGQVSLAVQRVRPPGRSRGTVVALAGGPGQPAIAHRSSFADMLGPVLRERELVVFDQRGTGRSGLLRCSRLERAAPSDLTAAAGECAARLGAARSHYTTRDSVADLEAVRAALGAERISLYGVSYGTKVALAYALAHPGRVERLVLDSAVPLDGPDPFSLTTFGAIRRVLAATCARRRCPGITPDLLGDVARLAARLRAAPLRGTFVGSRGQRRARTLGASDLLGLVLSADLDPALLPALPAAVRSALAADAAPVLRLAGRAEATAPDDPREFSAALYAATLCEEAPLPWERGAWPVERSAQAAARAAAIPEGAFAPFDRAAALDLGPVPLCLGWPVAPVAPALAGSTPAVPALVLAGSRDLRTPVADAQRVARALPGARLLTVTGVGHSVLGASLSECPRRAVARFLAGRSPAPRCRGDVTGEPVVDALLALLRPETHPIPPRRLSDVARLPGVPGARRSRTAAAAMLTFVDAFSSLFAALATEDGASVSVGGLRGGYAVADENGIALRRFVYVPGVTVSGRVSFAARGGDFVRLRVSGPAAAHGTIALSLSGRLRGRLDGRRFDVRSTEARLASSRAASRPPSPVALRRLREVARRVAPLR